MLRWHWASGNTFLTYSSTTWYQPLVYPMQVTATAPLVESFQTDIVFFHALCCAKKLTATIFICLNSYKNDYNFKLPSLSCSASWDSYISCLLPSKWPFHQSLMGSSCFLVKLAYCDDAPSHRASVISSIHQAHTSPMWVFFKLLAASQFNGTGTRDVFDFKNFDDNISINGGEIVVVVTRYASSNARCSLRFLTLISSHTV